MGQQHFTPRDIAHHGKGTRAYWAVTPLRKAVVFVHGFGGDPIDTWEDFHSLLRSHSSSSGVDLIYYGYDALYTRSRISAVDLKNFLVSLLEQPATLNLPGRPQSFAFDSVTIVAHSLGSIVSRQALLEARSENRTWLGKIQLVLFAPAHMGADVIRLASEAIFGLGPLGSIAAAVTKGYWQVLQDLEPNSQTLTLLQSECAQAIAAGVQCLVARKVILGKKDKVVSPNRFCQDPSPVVVDGKGHIDVCKPDVSYPLPVVEVAGVQ